jgi:hypothetical protein
MTEEQALQELREREPIFHRPELGTDYASMVTDDFREIGASGRIYSREYVLEVLADRLSGAPSQDVWETSDFACRKLSEEYFLLTYALLQNGVRRTRRTTLWRLIDGEWKIAFHQGTLAAS